MNINIPTQDRLIVALDVPSYAEAMHLVLLLGDRVHFYKIGMELLMSGDYFKLMMDLQNLGKKVFCDVKFFDVPATVGKAVKNLTTNVEFEPEFITVHGNDEMLSAAVDNNFGERSKILSVTCLTSMDQWDIQSLGFSCSPMDLVLSRARRALELGCDGVISSGMEVSDIRSELKDGQFIVVCPGIRPIVNNDFDDQKRTVDVIEAFTYGADYIVVGRPITQAEYPLAEAQLIQANIAQIFKRWCC